MCPYFECPHYLRHGRDSKPCKSHGLATWPLAAVRLFMSSQLDFGALSNGKSTVVEFYADWCEVCRELAPNIYKVEQQYSSIHFLTPNHQFRFRDQLDEFGVEGIPHFAFLDKNGNEEGNVAGRLPRKYLQENVDALARGEASVPHARVVGQYSSAESRKVH
ncbi:hypothetical protein ES288_D02G175400v1 [Gossypium darwinii]|uniref:Thioredoxin domain-containing protein n=1 Tax=Gossypium darwinii TaxID=34276 RepID=A0A5D2DI08_GOSDA|nr:hypothetical protein ES288_D02G175400v1 [Gossypium darwinii]